MRRHLLLSACEARLHDLRLTAASPPEKLESTSTKGDLAMVCGPGASPPLYWIIGLDIMWSVYPSSTNDKDKYHKR